MSILSVTTDLTISVQPNLRSLRLYTTTPSPHFDRLVTAVREHSVGDEYMTTFDRPTAPTPRSIGIRTEGDVSAVVRADGLPGSALVDGLAEAFRDVVSAGASVSVEHRASGKGTRRDEDVVAVGLTGTYTDTDHAALRRLLFAAVTVATTLAPVE